MDPGMVPTHLPDPIRGIELISRRGYLKGFISLRPTRGEAQSPLSYTEKFMWHASSVSCHLLHYYLLFVEERISYQREGYSSNPTKIRSGCRKV